MSFNPEEHIKRMTPYRDKLVDALKKKGFTFQEQDDIRKNVVFGFRGREIKISHHCFYRFSGICMIRKEIGEHEFTWIPVTDEMFMTSYMRSIIEYNFKEELKTK